MIPKIFPKFTQAEVKERLRKVAAAIEQAILLRLLRVAETFVRNARENGQYNDITGNLRNSIGYLILKDGVQMYEGFKRSAKVTKSQAGVIQGRELARQVAAKYPRGYALIVVAGMEYAAAVESRGKDVLTGSSQIARNDLKTALQAIDKKIGKIAA
jgi:hypothetical protein